MMKELLWAMASALLLPLIFPQTGEAQSSPEQSQTRLNPVVVNTNELEGFPHDAGGVKFVATSDDTNGVYAVLEVTEMPGFKTSWHRHNDFDETFYVLEGVLTIKIADRTYEMPVGSYISIPRGTPHGQGNFSQHPVKILTTVTPAGLEQFFADRVELFRTMPPGDPGFQMKYDQLRKKHRKWLEVLGTWEPQK